MISIPDLIGLVQTAVPDAEVDALDKTGMKDHFIIHVTSKAFEGVGSQNRYPLSFFHSPSNFINFYKY